jgi:hypothetical protein
MTFGVRADRQQPRDFSIPRSHAVQPHQLLQLMHFRSLLTRGPRRVGEGEHERRWCRGCLGGRQCRPAAPLRCFTVQFPTKFVSCRNRRCAVRWPVGALVSWCTRRRLRRVGAHAGRIGRRTRRSSHRSEIGTRLHDDSASSQHREVPQALVRISAWPALLGGGDRMPIPLWTPRPRRSRLPSHCRRSPGRVVR